MNILTPPGVSIDSSVAQRMRFIQMRRRGYSCEAILNHRIEQQQQILKDKTLQIACALLERQKNGEEVIDELIQEIGLIHILQAAQFQSENLSQTVKKLQQIQKDLTVSLAQSEKELSEKKSHVEALKKTLNTLSQALHNAKERYDFEDPLFECGKRLSKYISQNMM